MATSREQIEHFEHDFPNEDKPWQNRSHSRRWQKEQVNRYLRRKGKKIEDDEIGGKTARKPFLGYEY